MVKSNLQVASNWQRGVNKIKKNLPCQKTVAFFNAQFQEATIHMANFVGMKVRVLMKNGNVLEGVISYVSNDLMKMRQVRTSNRVIDDLTLSSSNIKNLEIIQSAQDNLTTTSLPQAQIETKLATNTLLTPSSFEQVRAAIPVILCKQEQNFQMFFSKN